MTRPTLLGLSVYPAIKPYNGGSNRIYNLARGCALDFSVTYLSQHYTPAVLRKNRWVSDSDNYREYVFLDLISAISQGGSRLLNVPELAHSAVYARVMPNWAKRLVRDADLLVVDQPWLFAWARQQRGPLKPIVYNAHNVEADMFILDRIPGPQWFRRRLFDLLFEQERTAARGSKVVLTTCDEDAKKISDRYGVDLNRIRVVPNGVDCSDFAPATDSDRRAAKAAIGLAGKRVILFCGAKHGPNVEAVNEILAWAAREHDSDNHFLIVGSISREFPDMRSQNVTFTGFVEDVRPYFAAADVAVNPMLSGGGTNLKQVEYLAAGIPSIATEFGARGVGFVDGINLLIREPHEMSAANELLAHDDAFARRIGAAGRVLAMERFDWREISSRLSKSYLSLIGGI